MHFLVLKKEFLLFKFSFLQLYLKKETPTHLKKNIQTVQQRLHSLKLNSTSEFKSGIECKNKLQGTKNKIKIKAQNNPGNPEFKY